jgi:hypothetical protein
MNLRCNRKLTTTPELEINLNCIPKVYFGKLILDEFCGGSMRGENPGINAKLF